MCIERDIHEYDDIINLPHPTSKKHPRMSELSRAAQFSPFAALTGHSEAITEAARVTDTKIELSEEKIFEINQKLNLLEGRIADKIPISVTYFKPDKAKCGGEYITVSSTLRHIDQYAATVILANKEKIPVSQICDISLEFKNNL